MKQKHLISGFMLIILLILFSSPVQSYHGPQAYLTETVTGSYNASGLDGASGTPGTLTREGYIDVSVPNTDDVLQYVRLNLSSNADSRSDIEVWNGTLTAYRDYALSNPTLSTRTRMYLNTTAASQQLTYTPDYNWAPPINLSMTVINTKGGNDLYSINNTETSINTMFFNFTIRNDAQAGNKNYVGSNVTVTIRFNETSATQSSASINYTTLSATSGSVNTTDSPGGSDDNDTITWWGPLNAGTEVYITFNATIEGTTNYVGKTNNLNGETSTIGTRATYTNSTAILTEITFTGRFTRGPIREGIDLMKSTSWIVKSFIRNMANSSVASGEYNLTYNVTAWRVYNVTESTGQIDQEINSNNNLNYLLGAGDEYKLPSWETASSAADKPYIAPYFDWHVLWNETDPYVYSGIVNITMQLPTLYEIDDLASKDSPDTFTPDVTGTRLLRYNLTATHNGATDNEVKSGRIQIYSVIPNEDTTESGYARMTINNSEVYYKNDTGTYNLTIDGSNIKITTTQSTTTSNGSIILDISDLSAASIYLGGAIGQNMTATNSIILYYEVYAYDNGSGTSGIDNGEWFHFDGNQTLWSQSGTPVTVSNSETRFASQNSLSAWKQLISYDPSTPELVNVTINLSTIGTIENIKFVDYLPTGITNTTPVRIISGGASWYENIHYNRTNLGTTITSDGLNVTVWEYTNVTPNGDGWNFTNEYLSLEYQMNISSAGVYVLPVQIAAFDPGVNQALELTRYGVIRIVVPEKQLPLLINDDGHLSMAKTIIVGKPAIFRKSFTIYNRNSRPTKSQFRTEVFKDTVNAYVGYYDIYGKNIDESVQLDMVDNRMYANWETTIGPSESRTYEIRVLTPPVIEVDRNVDVLEKLENKHVKLEAEIILKNFAEERYENVQMIVPIPSKNIFSIKDSFDNDLDYTEDTGVTIIHLGDFEKNSVKTIKVTYKESYPTIIITPDRTRYDSGKMASLEILVINGGEKIEDPYFETEIYTEQFDLMYADILKLESSLEPLEKSSLATKWKIPLNAPTGKYLANVRFREDFATISESSINFYVLGERSSKSDLLTIILIILGATIIYFLYARHRKKP